MGKQHYMFAFNEGIGGALAYTEEEATILMQAMAIKLGWNYKLFKMWKPTKEEWNKADMYLA